MNSTRGFQSRFNRIILLKQYCFSVFPRMTDVSYVDEGGSSVLVAEVLRKSTYVTS